MSRSSLGKSSCYTGSFHVVLLFLPQFFACLVILFACEVAAGIWGFMNRDQVSKPGRTVLHTPHQHALFVACDTFTHFYIMVFACAVLVREEQCLSNCPPLTECFPPFQVSKELIKFYDSAYDKASSISTTDKDPSVAVVHVFHETVRDPFLLSLPPKPAGQLL